MPDRGSGAAGGRSVPAVAVRSAAGYVYLIGPLEGCHKIGKANHVHKRLGQITTKLPVELRLVHSIPSGDPRWLESYLHTAFSHRRVRGEWFRLEGEEIAIIAAVPAADSPADLPPSLVALHDRAAAARKRARAARGTRPSMYRLGQDTLADMDLIAAEIATPGTLPASRAEAIRYAVRRVADEFRKKPDSKSP